MSKPRQKRADEGIACMIELESGEAGRGCREMETATATRRRREARGGRWYDVGGGAACRRRQWAPRVAREGGGHVLRMSRTIRAGVGRDVVMYLATEWKWAGRDVPDEDLRKQCRPRGRRGPVAGGWGGWAANAVAMKSDARVRGTL